MAPLRVMYATGESRPFLEKGKDKGPQNSQILWRSESIKDNCSPVLGTAWEISMVLFAIEAEEKGVWTNRSLITGSSPATQTDPIRECQGHLFLRVSCGVEAAQSAWRDLTAEKRRGWICRQGCDVLMPSRSCNNKHTYGFSLGER